MWHTIMKSYALADVHVQDIWRQLADEIGATYIPTEDGNLIESYQFSKTYSTNYGAVIHQVGGWAITLDSYRTTRDDQYRPTGKITVFMKAPISNREGFRFSIYPKTFPTSLRKILGLQDIRVGDAGFDNEYIIKATDEEKVKALLASERIRQLVRSSREVNLSIRECEAEGWATLLGVRDQLYWARRGWGSITKDLRLLKQLFELFEETLGHLHSMGYIGDAR